MNDDNPIASIERENVEAASASHKREDDEDHSEEEANEVRVKEFDMQDALEAANKDAYRVVRDAVESAAKGENPLTIPELAYAISVGLFTWGKQKEVMAEVAKAILEQTGEPWSVVNKAEEHA